MDYRDSLDHYRKMINDMVSEKKILEKQLLSVNEDIRKTNEYLTDTIDARAILTEVAKMTQVQVKEYIEDLVTLALQSVFRNRSYKFIAEFTVKKNRPDVNLLVSKDGKSPYSPEDEQAGSVVDIISFALRVVLWSIQKNRSRAVLILDEPFKFTGKWISIAGQMLKDVSSKLGIQIIMVTHSDDLMEIADRAWIVSRDNDRSLVRIADGSVQKPKLKRRGLLEQIQRKAIDVDD